MLWLYTYIYRHIYVYVQICIYIYICIYARSPPSTVRVPVPAHAATEAWQTAARLFAEVSFLELDFPVFFFRSRDLALIIGLYDQVGLVS